MNTHCCSCSSCTCCLYISLSPSDSPVSAAEGKSFDLHPIRLYAPHCALAFRRWPTIYMITDMGAVPWLLVNDEWSWRWWQSVWSKCPTNICKKKQLLVTDMVKDKRGGVVWHGPKGREDERWFGPYLPTNPLVRRWHIGIWECVAEFQRLSTWVRWHWRGSE